MSSPSPPSETKPTLTGSCACHHIQYTTSTLPLILNNCHCTTCRKQSGAAYQTWAIFPSSSIVFMHGEADLLVRRSSTFATRTACSRCGSSISMRYDFNPEGVGIAAGTIDSSSGSEVVPRPARHIYLKEKAGWFEVPEDGAERWEGHFDGVREVIQGILGEDK
ncbi:hypothetical protein P170DRAFT_441677 [Aspergillus steynii IBT 23096]|uniref:CENP-V/GFA domain-containing protein n=1 Tax=Aspergillus steynii IBT 23096 TaxID=1392250 RepID=A0A2I2FRG6_9EURO|nr:uncharacterized protein P170DRAFT_441677 [Aspergillus steynii IBT 23096]PLB43222.1 hypothetical protein P170DRAFT_441677 [Aspergillus steynii IBT 23096]